MCIQIKPRNKVFTAFMVLLPVFNIYGLFNEMLPLGEFILLICAASMMFSGDSFKRPAKVDYLMFLLTMLLLTLLDYAIDFFRGIDLGTVLRLIKELLLVLVVGRGALHWMDVQYGARIYKIVVNTFSVVIILQMIAYLLIGFTRPLVINNEILRLCDVGGYESWITFYYNYLPILGFRPSAFFSEPAKYAHYAGFCMVLILWKKEKNFSDQLSLVIITAALLICRSGAGAMYILLAWAYRMYDRFISKRKVTEYIALGAGWTFFGIIMILIFMPNLFSIFNRITEVFNTAELSSGSLRVHRGWAIFEQLPMYNILFGVGMKNIVNFLQHRGIVTVYDAGYLGYMSGLSEVFVAGGLVGAATFALLVWRLWRTNMSRCKTGVLQLLILMLLIAASFHSDFYLVALAFLLCFANDIDGSLAAYWE